MPQTEGGRHRIPLPLAACCRKPEVPQRLQAFPHHAQSVGNHANVFGLMVMHGILRAGWHGCGTWSGTCRMHQAVRAGAAGCAGHGQLFGTCLRADNAAIQVLACCGAALSLGSAQLRNRGRLSHHARASAATFAPRDDVAPLHHIRSTLTSSSKLSVASADMFEL